MKLRNKKTGEIVEVESLYLTQNQELQLTFTNEKNERILYMTGKISTFENEWEDYEEPKEHWFINSISGIETTDIDERDEPGRAMIEIGNYFESPEEAEKAVEKLKAWKRLKDKGFRFKGLCESVYELPAIEYDIDVDVSRDSQEDEDLDLLFCPEGGEK